MKSINNNQTQLGTLFIGVLCVIAGVMCFAHGFSHGSVSPAVSQSTGGRLGDSASSVDVRDAVTPQFASITPRYVTKRVADIEIGEDVVSRDPQSGEVTTKRVANVFRRVSDHLRILKVRNPETDELQTIETTNEHPFWVTARRDWIKAKDLNIGDHLDDVDGGQAILESTEFESHPDGIPVFNFEVEDFHNYYVRAHGSRGPPVLVHNADGYDILQTQILNATPPGINGLPGTGVFGDGIPSGRAPVFADNDVLVHAFRGNQNALSELRAGTTYVTPNQYREFLNVNEVGLRQAFLDKEGVVLFDGARAHAASQTSQFQQTFGAIVNHQGRGDAALAAFADSTRFEAITMERRLFNFVTQTMRNSTVPMRRIQR